jgi:hypothetical protein
MAVLIRGARMVGPVGTFRLLALCAVISSCGREGGERDVREAANGTTTLSLERIVVIGSGTLDVGHLAALTVDDAGRIFVLDTWPRAERILAFSPDGERLGRVAGPGAGPGELRSPIHSLAWRASTLTAFDGELYRITEFDALGERVATYPWSAGPRFPRRLYSGDRFVFGLDVRWSVDQDYNDLTFWRIEAGGEVTTLPALADTIPGMLRLYCSAANGDLAPLEASFHDSGPLTAFISDDVMARAYPGEDRIRLIDASSGELLRSVGVAYEPTPFRMDDWYRTEGGQWALQYERDGGGPLVSLEDPEAPCPLSSIFPELAPPIFSLVVDDSDRLWIETVRPDVHDGLTLAVYDRDGTLLGEGPMPERDARVTHMVRGNQLYLSVVDAFGVQSVEVYRVRFPNSD